MYKNSGYDRGHLVASADRKSSQSANRATFLMTNIAPQTAALNRGTWKLLEEQARRWTSLYDTLYIVCGTIIEGTSTKIANSVTIPSKFYKAILFAKKGQYSHKCYVMPNDTLLNKNYDHYEVTLDSLERAAEIDLIWNNPQK